MLQLLAYQVWLSLPSDIRHKLVVLFDIPKSGSTTVEYRASGNVVTSDGFTPNDLRAISVERMQLILGTDSTDFYRLFEAVVDNIDPLLGGTFSESGGFHISSPASTPPESGVVIIEETVIIKETVVEPAITWPKFFSEQKKMGKTPAEASAAWKELKK